MCTLGYDVVHGSIYGYRFNLSVVTASVVAATGRPNQTKTIKKRRKTQQSQNAYAAVYYSRN